MVSMGTSEPTLERVACPACGEDGSRPLYDKSGFAVVRCLDCGVGYVNPRPDAAWLAAYYRREYFAPTGCLSSGVSHLRHGDMKAATAGLRLAAIEAHLHPGRLLDLGSGGGDFVLTATRAGWKAVGLELGASAAGQAVRQLGVRMVVGQLEQAPFFNHTFDVVTMFDVLEHVASPHACLAEARRLLAPHGLLVVDTPNLNGLMPRLMGVRHPWVRPPEHLTYFTPASLRRLLERSGFEVRALSSRTPKVLSLDYVLSLTAHTNPLATTILRKTIGRWSALARRPFQLSTSVLLALARPAQSAR
jgi:2-polyprenyl-3-methyl-5-hydroxy-6-metoxy-1,4-benzoquinol methylase